MLQIAETNTVRTFAHAGQPTDPAPTLLRNTVLQGDCIEAMRGLPANGVDFILTGPP